jgi:hypothetical protein
MIICAAVARGGEVKVKAVITGPDGEQTTTFTTGTPKVMAEFKTTGGQGGDKIRGVWIADDVGDAAPAKTKIDESTITMVPLANGGTFSMSKPTKGWPAGKYHVEIYANGKLATTAKFTIEAMEKAEKRDAAEKEEKAAEKSEKGSDESADDAQYTFTVHNNNVQRITKLLASEDGKDYLKFDIGNEGIDVGESMKLNWDKATNKTGCEWYLKAVYADKSVGEAVKFDFCQEDLVIDF